MYFLLLPFTVVSHICYKFFRAYVNYQQEIKAFYKAREFKKDGVFFSLRKSVGGGHNKDLLIIGDSMSLSIGSNECSLHKLFIKEFNGLLDVDIVGRAGSRSRELYKMTKKIKGKYKNIWVFIGPNDVVSLNPTFNKYLHLAFKKIKRHGVNVIWSVGDVHIAPMFPYYLKFIPKLFGDKLKKTSNELAKKHNIKILNVVCSNKKDPFFMNPNEYFAKDGFHPNDNGYKYIFNKLMSLSNFDFPKIDKFDTKVSEFRI